MDSDWLLAYSICSDWLPLDVHRDQIVFLLPTSQLLTCSVLLSSTRTHLHTPESPECGLWSTLAAEDSPSMGLCSNVKEGVEETSTQRKNVRTEKYYCAFFCSCLCSSQFCKEQISSAKQKLCSFLLLFQTKYF